ncbi:MAG: acetyl-CoA C-acetyltransferase [Armatimonadota bacterium]
MRNVLMLVPARTPIGDIGGSLAKVSAVSLGITAASASLERAGIAPDQVDEAIFGNVLQAGQGQNPARQIAMGAGVPQRVPSFTVNKVCGSGLKAVDLGWQSILLGRADVVLAGGIESMSQAPYLLPAMREGARLGHAQVIDSVVGDGLTDVFGQYHMGITAENLAAQFDISRADQDAFAAESHRRYAAAVELYHQEIVPVTIKGRKGDTVVSADEHPRPHTSVEKLSALRPAFKPDGTVTAGNASGINDGAAAVLLIAEEACPAGADAMLIRGVAAAGCDPAAMGLGPFFAVRKLLAEQGLTVADIDLWELNEAFAVQSLAVLRELHLDPAKVNVNGGAIALGHPIGASGARILVTLFHQMKRQGAALGIAALCIGGGMGIAMLLENR